MRAMKDSGIAWIGEIPQDWGICRVKNLFAISGGNGFKEYLQGNTSGEYPFYKVSDINGEGIFADMAANYVSSSTVKEYGFNLIPKGSIILSKIGEALKKNHRKIASVDCIIDNNLQAMVPTSEIDQEYFYYLFRCVDMGWFDNGGTIPSVNNQRLLDFKLVCPNISEQVRIRKRLAAKCAEIDALIAAKEQTNALLKERRQSIIYEAVTKGLDPNAPTKDSGVAWIGMVPKEWRIAPLKHFATIQTGFTLGRQYAPEKCVEYSYLRVANVQGEFTDLSDVATIMMPPEEAEQYKLHSGELLMTEGGDRDKLGRGSVWRGEIADCLHQNHIFAVATNAELLVEYLNYLTTSNVGRQYFDFSAKKTTNLASTNSTTIMNFRIPIPPVNDQQRIVTYLNETCGSIDALIQKNTNIVVALREYRQSLIYEAVTGKIEV